VPIAATDEQLALQASIRDWRTGRALALVRAWSRAWASAARASGPAGVARVGWTGLGWTGLGGPCWPGWPGWACSRSRCPRGAGPTHRHRSAAALETHPHAVPGPVLPHPAGRPRAGAARGPARRAAPAECLAAGKTRPRGPARSHPHRRWQPTGRCGNREIGPVLSGGASGQLLAAAVTGTVRCVLHPGCPSGSR